MTLREATRILADHNQKPPLTFGREMRLEAEVCESDGSGGWVAGTAIETIPATRSALYAWLGY